MIIQPLCRIPHTALVTVGQPVPYNYDNSVKRNVGDPPVAQNPSSSTQTQKETERYMGSK